MAALALIFLHIANLTLTVTSTGLVFLLLLLDDQWVQRGPSNMFINFLVSRFLLGVIVIPLHLAATCPHHLAMALRTCRVALFTQTTVDVVAVWSVVTIASLNWYKTALKKNLSRWESCIILFSWVCALALGSAHLYTGGGPHHHGNTTTHPWQNRTREPHPFCAAPRSPAGLRVTELVLVFVLPLLKLVYFTCSITWHNNRAKVPDPLTRRCVCMMRALALVFLCTSMLPYTLPLAPRVSPKLHQALRVTALCSGWLSMVVVYWFRPDLQENLHRLRHPPAPDGPAAARATPMRHVSCDSSGCVFSSRASIASTSPLAAMYSQFKNMKRRFSVVSRDSRVAPEDVELARVSIAEESKRKNSDAIPEEAEDDAVSEADEEKTDVDTEVAEPEAVPETRA